MRELLKYSLNQCVQKQGINPVSQCCIMLWFNLELFSLTEQKVTGNIMQNDNFL